MSKVPTPGPACQVSPIESQQTGNSHNRDVSSSEDNCRCENCRNNFEDLNKTYNQRHQTNVYMFKHLNHAKRRGVPPIKKDAKEFSQKAKYLNRKGELEKKERALENNPEMGGVSQSSGLSNFSGVTSRQKLLEAIRSKDSVSSSSFVVEYHPVSHSQRQKIASSNIQQLPRRVVNLEDLRTANAFTKELRPKVGPMKLVQICENPENLRQLREAQHGVLPELAVVNEGPSNMQERGRTSRSLSLVRSHPSHASRASERSQASHNSDASAENNPSLTDLRESHLPEEPQNPLKGI